MTYKDADIYLQSLKKLFLGLLWQLNDIIRVPGTFILMLQFLGFYHFVLEFAL